MKLGTLKDGTRDGVLVVVSRDLALAVPADHIAPTLQDALDDWAYAAPQLATLYEDLNRAPLARSFATDFGQFAAPLPRAYQRVRACAYPNHAELRRGTRDTETAADQGMESLLFQGGSDAFLGPGDDVVVESEDWDIDIEGAVAVVTDDVPMGTRPDKAGEHIRLVTLASDVCLRNLPPAEPARGFAAFNGRTWTAFAPVAVAPEELGTAWRGGKLHLPLFVQINGEALGNPNAGADMSFGFYRLIAHAARTRPLSAGTIVGSGAVSNRDRRAGSACIAEKRAIETIESGQATTPFLRFGDRVRIEMLDPSGKSVFGAIDQRVAQHVSPR